MSLPISATYCFARALASQRRMTTVGLPFLFLAHSQNLRRKHSILRSYSARQAYRLRALSRHGGIVAQPQSALNCRNSLLEQALLQHPTSRMNPNEATPQTDEPCRMNFSIAVFSDPWRYSRLDGCMNVAQRRCFLASGLPEPRSSIPPAAPHGRPVLETSRHVARSNGEGVFVESSRKLDSFTMSSELQVP